MAKLTRLQIVTAGMLQGQRDDLASVLNEWFNVWLRKEYAAWPWTFLKRKKSAFALASGITSLAVGAGSGSVTEEIQKILDPILIYNSDYSVKQRARIKQLTGGGVDFDEIINNPTTTIGVPSQFKVRADESTWGKWNLIPYPIPDRALLLTFDYIVQPADIDTSTAGDASVPLYPSDRTMIQSVLVETLRYSNGADSADYQQALDLLGGYTIDDRVKYGQVPGDNDLIQLDSSVFR